MVHDALPDGTVIERGRPTMGCNRSNRLIGPEIIDELRARTMVADIAYLNDVDSTNTYARTRISLHACEFPLLVLTDDQTAGRGRGDHRWWSGKGALTFSLALAANNVPFPIREPRLALAMGLAVCDAVCGTRPGLDVALKWPNDVFVDQRKVCGILVELPSQSADHAIVGVGINVNNSTLRAPADLAATATSLCDVTRHSWDVGRLLIGILQHAQHHINQLSARPEWLADQWSHHCMLTGRHVEVAAGGKRWRGECRGIDVDGALRLQTVHGECRVTSGTVVNICK